MARVQELEYSDWVQELQYLAWVQELGTGAGYSDLITFIRKDYNAKIVNNDTQEDISYLITEVSAEGDRIVIVNIYARDGKLKGEHFNYTQKIPHIRNGLQLKKFQQGKTSIDTSQLPALIHNINDQSECTHTTNDRKWAQIDYIISHTNITHKLMNMSYEYELISDHQGLSVMAPKLFQEIQTLSKVKYVTDWKTYNPWNY